MELEVNEAVEHIVRCVPPFPFVRESLEKLQAKADLLGRLGHAERGSAARMGRARSGEIRGGHLRPGIGTKKELLTAAKKYQADHTLMIGDAPGDYKAAEANQALFYPDQSRRGRSQLEAVLDEGIDRFLNGTFAGEYQQKLLAEFDSLSARSAAVGEKNERLRNYHWSLVICGYHSRPMTND